MGNICEQMNEMYNEIAADRQEYLIDIEEQEKEAEAAQEDMQAQIEKLQAEINELQAKTDNGIITEEEQEELESKKVNCLNL